MRNYYYIYGSILDADGKVYKTTEHGDRTREYRQVWYNESGYRRGDEDRSAYDSFALLRWSVYVLLLRLASFGATPRPLSRLRGWSGLRFSGGGGCVLGHIGGTRGGGTVDGGVRPLIGVNFTNGLVVSELLVHESEGGGG